MRRLFLLSLFLSLAAAADGINLNPAVIKTFTDCSSSGSSAQTVVGGTYLLTIADENVWLCFTDSGSTCASGGVKLPSGTVMKISIANAGQSVSCRSTSSTGDAQFTSAN